MNRFWIIICLLCLPACQMRLNYPKDIYVDEIQSVPQMVETKPIAFSYARIDLKRGTTVTAHPFLRFLFPNVNIGFFRMCNPTLRHRLSRSTVKWTGSNTFGKGRKEWADYVEQPLKEMGYDIVSGDTSLFRRGAEQMRSELTLAAKIIDVRMNVCNIWTLLEARTSLAGGDAYLKVEWEIYDPLRKRGVGKIITEGIGYVDEPEPDGVSALLLNALQDAAFNLGHSQKFYQIMTGDFYEPKKNSKAYSLLEIEASKKPFVQKITEHFNLTRRAAITVRTSTGHGSGFFINSDGYALTNAHVVGDAKTVAIVDFSGVQYMADVLRLNEERDVALIKADITRNSYFPISKRNVKVTDTVYAIGTPLRESLKTTITKGIVSALRYRNKQELSFYQVDAEIAPGSSGGPLVDELGNVIGLAVSGTGFATKDMGTSYGNFIPIEDALHSLNIQIVSTLDGL